MITLEKHLKHATSTIIDILTKQTSDSTTTPLLDITDKTSNGLLKLAQILNHHADNIPRFNIDLSSSSSASTQKDIAIPMDSQPIPSSPSQSPRVMPASNFPNITNANDVPASTNDITLDPNCDTLSPQCSISPRVSSSIPIKPSPRVSQSMPSTSYSRDMSSPLSTTSVDHLKNNPSDYSPPLRNDSLSSQPRLHLSLPPSQLVAIQKTHEPSAPRYFLRSQSAAFPSSLPRTLPKKIALHPFRGFRFRPASGPSLRSRLRENYLAQHLFQCPSLNILYNAEGKKETIDTICKGE